MAEAKSGDKVLADVQKFDKEKGLKHVEVTEKVVLPDKDGTPFYLIDIFLAIEKEKTEVSLRQEIEQGKDLKHVKTTEKNVLPTKQDIEAEKKSS
ncbi:unnamed protein product [Dibothriocephalus latus]|uniref:Uncharacterized protein n=1 Tax=Dibothriocephalus latus TaxID=60516 RepID=A0A3P7MQF8_DIBLA|nr:unnamed protein product [Dibothriocephalus latus]